METYKLNDIAHSWYNMWRDSRALGGSPIILDFFKIPFLGRFFPRYIKEAKVEEFINLKLGLDLSKGLLLDVCKSL